MKYLKQGIILILVLCLSFGLVACGGDKAKDDGAPAKEDSAPAKEDGKITVALLVGALGDMSFNDSAHVGLQRAAKDFSDKIELKVIEFSDDSAKIEPTLIEASEAGYDLIISSSTMQEAVELHAEEYPNCTYIIFDAEVNWDAGDYKNVYCIIYKANEASYLGGYLAASMSDSGVIGFLGGTDQPIISDFLVGYIQGAQEAKPDIKVATGYVGSWTDSPKGKELSLAMYNQGAGMIFNVAGGSGNGLIEAGVEKGKYVLGVDSDQAMVYKANGEEQKAEVIPSSVLKNVGDSLYRATDLFLKGELPKGETERLGIVEGGVGLADNEYYQKMVPEELRKEIEALKERIISGEIEIDTAYGKTTDEISAIRDAVKP